MTIFHLLQLMIAGACAGVGVVLAQPRFGTPGAILGGILGLLIGAVVGRVPFLVAWFFARPQRFSSEKLRSLMRGSTWPYAHLAIAELARRGESIVEGRAVVREMLLSDDPAMRMHGHTILIEFYPDLAGMLGEYDPDDASSATRERMAALPWNKEST